MRYDSTSAQHVCFLRPLRRSKRLRNIASLLLSNVSLYNRDGIKMRLGKQLGRDCTAYEHTSPSAWPANNDFFSKILRILRLLRNLGQCANQGGPNVHLGTGKTGQECGMIVGVDITIVVKVIGQAARTRIECRVTGWLGA